MSAGGLYTALSGAIAQSQALDAVANNVANASTQGFRAERVRFEEVLHEAAGPQGRQVIAARGDQDPRAGNITQTNQPLDVALEGEGALQVVDGRGEVRDVRGGSFGRDAEGLLVDGEGRALLGDDGQPLVVSPEARTLAIGEDGTVRADDEPVGRLAIRGTPRVLGGALEGSNVNVVRSMVDLVKISRTYEALTRMIEGYKAIDERTARELGNPR